MIQEITQSQAFYHWNKFTFELPSLVPFSFNPSLFNFYRKYFNWKPYYILIFDSNKVLGVLPVVFTERSWVSVPHFSYGGYLSSGLPKNLSVETLMGLIDGLVHYDSGFYILDIKDIKPALKKSSSRLFIR